MLNALAQDNSDGDDSEEDADLLYAIPAGFERTLDRHIPRDNSDEMWKDGAVLIILMMYNTK